MNTKASSVPDSLGFEAFVQQTSASPADPPTSGEDSSPLLSPDASGGEVSVPPPDGTSPSPPEPIPDPPVEAPPAGEPPSPTEPPQPAGPDWEVVENPYKERALRLEKQYTDTRNWATQIQQSNAELRRQVELLGKRMDGTYDPAIDEAPAAPSVEQAASHSELMGRVQASIAVANQLYGDAEVQQLLFAEGAPYRQLEDSDPAIRARVLAAPAPAIEAMRVLQERAFFQQYGNDPATVREKIRQEHRGEMEKELNQLVEKKLKERLKLVHEGASSLGDARGNGQPDAKGAKPTHAPLSQLGNPGLA